MNIVSTQIDISHIRLPRYSGNTCYWSSSKQMTQYLLRIFEVLPFNIAIRFDPYWTDLDDISSPISELEDHEIEEYLSNSGKIITRSPLTWEFRSYKQLLEIIHGFFNADDSSILQIDNFRDEDISKLKPSFDELTSISEYFITTLADYTGFIIISKNSEKIISIGNQLANIENLNYSSYIV